MALEIITGEDHIIGPWVMERSGGTWIPGQGQAVGILRDGVLVGGVVYQDYNGVSLRVHQASDGSRRWLSKKVLFLLFWYPFIQLGCRSIIGVIPESNLDARRSTEHAGFELQSIIPDTHPDGGLCVYALRRENCKWLSHFESEVMH